MKYEPSPWGREYHALTVNEALGGGAAGPGKSLVLLMDPMEQVVVEHERCRAGEVQWGHSSGWALHLRREFPRLEQTIHRSHLLFKKVDPHAKYDPQNHRWTFSSGYKYSFGHLKDATSYLNYRSNEYTHLGIDEIGEIEHKDSFDELSLRVRSTDPVLSKMLKVRAMTNPTANWVRDLFVDPAPNGRVIFRRKIRLDDGSIAERTRIFLPARLSDNPDPEFRRQYEASLRDRPPHIRAALLDGDWYIVAGAFFADVWDPQLVIVKPFRIPSGWLRFRSGDWGYKQQCVILWWAISPEGEMICYRERTFNGPKAKVKHDAIAVAEAIRDIERANNEWNNLHNRSRLNGPMDTQLWEERGRRGPSMADDMARIGVYWQKATKGRRMAAQQIIKRLTQRGYNGRPGLMFFETCIKCISTIPALGTDETDPEMPKKGGPDHWYDAVSYAAAANPLPSGKDDAEDFDDDDDDEGSGSKPRGSYGYGGN